MNKSDTVSSFQFLKQKLFLDKKNRKMPLVIPLKQTSDVDLVKPVSSFLRNTFAELGAEAALEMARQFDNQRRVACIKGKF